MTAVASGGSDSEDDNEFVDMEKKSKTVREKGSLRPWADQSEQVTI